MSTQPPSWLDWVLCPLRRHKPGAEVLRWLGLSLICGLVHAALVVDLGMLLWGLLWGGILDGMLWATLVGIDRARDEAQQALPPWFIVVVISSLSTLLVFLATNELRHYGLGLFVGVPLAVGALVALMQGSAAPGQGSTRLPRLLGLTLASLGGSALWLLLCRIEGVICLLMAAWLGSLMALIGVLLARWLLPWLRRRYPQGRLFCAVATLPFLAMLAELAWRPKPPVMVEQSEVLIEAPLQAVWPWVPQFPRIAQEPQGLLAALTRGVAYPLEARMEGQGVGAKRFCVLSTGAMPERITVWQPEKALEFEVLSTPPCMEESNPFGEVHAHHLQGYFQCLRGRFDLEALPDGRTRVRGRSWFVQDLWPQWYWQPAARFCVHRVQRRVLDHIKALAEAQGPRVSSAR